MYSYIHSYICTIEEYYVIVHCNIYEYTCLYYIYTYMFML